MADDDEFMDMDQLKQFFSDIGTPEHLKEIQGYNTDHSILNDGSIIDELVAKQIFWLGKILSQ